MSSTWNRFSLAIVLCLGSLLAAAAYSDVRQAQVLPDPPPLPSVRPGRDGQLALSVRRAPVRPGGQRDLDVPGILSEPTDGPRTPSPSLEFEGVDGTAKDGFFHKPPDTHVAVGTGSGAAGRVVMVTNSGLQIWDKTGTSLAGPTPLDTFLGTTVPDAFDPKVLFDQHSGRFFIVALEGTTPSGLSAMSNVHIAVSSSSTPGNLTTDWTTLSGSALTTIGAFATWFDYPGIGADDDSLFVTGNLFDAGGSFRGVKIRVFDKSALLAGSYTFVDLDYDTSFGSTIQPAHVYGTTDSGNFYLVNRWGATAYRLWEISGDPGAPTLEGNALRAWAAGSLLSAGAPQLDSSITLDLLSPRVQNAVYRNGIISAALTSDKDSDSKSEVFWAKIATNGGLPTAPTISDSGYIDGSDGDEWTFMPAINVNAHGDTIICYSQSYTDQYADMRYATRAYADAAGTFTASVVAKTSIGFYDAFDTDNPERWGDYAGAVVDPTDDSFWVAHEYGKTSAVDTSIWGTYIVKTPAPTSAQILSFNYDGGLCSWRTSQEVDNLGFHLYREDRGERTRLTPSLVAGSALAEGGTASVGGRSYSWWDTGLMADAYWLEAVDLNGYSSWHGPFAPVPSRKSVPDPAPAVLLSALGSGESGAGLVRAAGVSSGGQAAARRAPVPVPDLRRLAAQWQLAAKPAVKISVREEGWYRVGQPALVAAGLNPRINPRSLRLFADGEEQACIVTGERDGRLDPGDALEFYGVGRDTPSTDTRVYWLVAGPGRGKRIQTAQAVALGGASGSFPFTVELKERSIYFSALTNGEANNFFGPVVTSTPVDLTLGVRHLDAAPPGPALLEVALQGVTDVPQPGPDHHVAIRLNGAPVAEVVFDGRSQGVAAVPIPQALLREGGNQVTLAAGPGETDVSLVDTIRLNYWHTYAADGNVLRFVALGNQQVTVGGFSSARIRVMDVTDPQAVQEIAGTVGETNTGFAVQVDVPGPLGGRRELLAFSEEQVRAPAAITANAPSAWYRMARGSDFVIIAHRLFQESLAPLKALRERQGLSVSVIDVEDLYDEFNYGEKSPWALRNFLAWTRTQWRRAPHFVLLAGDATFDPRNYLGAGDFDFVPTQMVATAVMETASDDWFTDFNDDGLPDMAVGRLPFRSAQQAAAVVAKIVSYELAGANGGRRALLVADENAGFDFAAASTSLRTLLPTDMAVEQITGGQRNVRAARTELLAGIAAGQTIVHYLGHGAAQNWAHGLLTTRDADSLGNSQSLPFFIATTCLNGYFQDVGAESLAESLLDAANGGAVAVWASSGLTQPGGQWVMDRELYRLLFGNVPAVLSRSMTLGEAVARAKAAVGDRDVRRTWILFGDPTTRLP
ncbi:MAG: hypothetical protein HY320_03625 [Armatimonadetes bacterium]|nr:hypothetical protein [Armatimonadota bacterium]